MAFSKFFNVRSMEAQKQPSNVENMLDDRNSSGREKARKFSITVYLEIIADFVIHENTNLN